MISRQTYTKIFLKAADVAADKVNLKYYDDLLWYNRRVKKTGGLRLTEAGYQFLVEQVKLDEFVVQFESPIKLSPTIVLYLDKFMTAPYYLTNKSLTLFTEKDAFEMHLFSNDIEKLGINEAIKARERHQMQSQ